MDNIGKRILGILKEKGMKPTPFEDRIEISRGYLKRAAENGTGLGSEIVEKILLEFPGTDAYWLITGTYLSRNTDDNLTDLTKNMNNEDLNLEVKMVKRLLAFMDEAKTELQRKYDRLQSEVDGLRMENQSLKEQLRNCTSTNDKSK
jgi:hypothetical protein